MRALQISGVILIAAALFVLIKPPSYSHEESVFKVGDIEAKLQEQRTLPSWVGGALLGVGCVLVIAGLKKSS